MSFSSLRILGSPCSKEVMAAEMMKENRQRHEKDSEYKSKRLKIEEIFSAANGEKKSPSCLREWGLLDGTWASEKLVSRSSNERRRPGQGPRGAEADPGDHQGPTPLSGTWEVTVLTSCLNSHCGWSASPAPRSYGCFTCWL